MAGLLSGIGDLTGNLVKIFDNGLEIYAGVKERINALELINNDISEQGNTAVVAPASTQETSTQAKTAQLNSTISFLLIAAGAIGAILLVIALRRK